MSSTHRLSRRTLMKSGAAFGAATALAPMVRAAEPLKVAGLHGSPVENAWNTVLHKALLDLASEGTIDYVFAEGIAAPDYPRAMREYAEQGIPLIIGETYPVEAKGREAAAEYPGTSFVMGSSGEPEGDNFGVFGTWNHEGAYLAGMLAGRMTTSNVIGSVGAVPIPEVNQLINAFAAGARSVNPDITHKAAFIGTFFDPPKAREAGLALIDSGADILFGERIGTADAAKEHGIKAVGSLIDYTPMYPETVFANALWGFRGILNAVIADVVAGVPAGRDYTAYGLMKEGGSDISYVSGVAPADAEEEMERVRATIRSGEFEVPRDTSQPA